MLFEVRVLEVSLRRVWVFRGLLGGWCVGGGGGGVIGGGGWGGGT